MGDAVALLEPFVLADVIETRRDPTQLFIAHSIGRWTAAAHNNIAPPVHDANDLMLARQVAAMALCDPARWMSVKARLFLWKRLFAVMAAADGRDADAICADAMARLRKVIR
jgi:uncharacterized iron-regulated membrane protein